MIIAGEASGDLHGSSLIKALKLKAAGYEFFGIGGNKMEKEGVELLFHMKDLAFMGFTEVIKHLPYIKKVRNKLEEELLKRKPDIVILIDYPGFNLRFAPFCRKSGVPVFYYISPQVWAWGSGRIKKISKVVSHMAVVFPFEELIYKHAGLPVTFVGHPLLEVIRSSVPEKEFLSSCSLSDKDCIIGLLPGSRKQEVTNLLPPMIDAVNLMKENIPEIKPVVGASEFLPVDLYKDLIRDDSVQILYDNTYNIMNYSDLLLVSSGTATLESAIFAKPMIIMYKVSFFSYILARLLVNIEYIGMANIIAGKKIVPELIQFDVLGSKIASEAKNLLKDTELYEKTVKNLSLVKENLGNPGASEKTAELVLKVIKENE